MRHSVRARLIAWFQGVFDNVAEKSPKVLGNSKVHSEAGSYGHDAVIIGVKVGRAKGQVDDTVIVSPFSDDINKLNRNTIVSNIPPVGSDSDLPTARNYDLGSGSAGRNFLINAHDYNSSRFGKSYLNSQSMGESTCCESEVA